MKNITSSVVLRLLEIAQAGLVDYWDLWFRPMPPQCQQNIKTALDRKTLKMKDKPPALTLKNLTGAFLVLLFGLGFSFLAFICELIISISNSHIHRLQKAASNSVNTAENTQDNPAVNAEVKNDDQEMNALNISVEIN